MRPKQVFAFTLAALLAGALGGWLGSQLITSANAAQPGRLVLNEGLLLVDDQGRVRAELAFRKIDGSVQPGLFLYGEDGRERLGITALPPDGRPGVALSDARGQTRLWLGLDRAGAPVVGLYDQGDQLRAALGAVTLRPAGGERAEQRPPSSLVLLNEGGRVAWSAP